MVSIQGRCDRCLASHAPRRLNSEMEAFQFSPRLVVKACGAKSSYRELIPFQSEANHYSLSYQGHGCS